MCGGANALPNLGTITRQDHQVHLKMAPGLFFVFADKTNGHETYVGGRFLYTALPQNGKVILHALRLILRGRS